MAAASINILMRCEDCGKADAYGRGCEHGLMFPVLAFIGGVRKCPNFVKKNKEQLEEQLKILEKNETN